MSRNIVLPALLILATAAATAAAGLLPDRRRSQFLNEPGYVVAPYAYNLPGIGLGYGVLAAATNIGRSYTDLAATAFAGDADGQATYGDVWDIVRQSYGAGVRMVTASGLVYRLDFATGDEGFQPSVFFQYPWEL